MRRQHIVHALKWFAFLSVLAALLGGAYVWHFSVADSEAPGEDEPAVAVRAPGGVVGLSEESIGRYGLQVEPARPVRWSPRLTVYGRVVPNPKATYEVRSPYAGTLHGRPDWPGPGQRVRAGEKLGWVEVRVSPDVRLDLRQKLEEARIREKGAREEVRLLTDRINSLKAVTGAVIDRNTLDVVQVQLAQAEAQVATASAAAEQWQQALKEIDGRPNGTETPWRVPLLSPADGEVTELSAQPGTAVEPGAAILQVVDFRRLWVRLDLPAGVLTVGVPDRVELLATPAQPSPLRGLLQAHGSADSVAPVTATLIGAAPYVDIASQLAGYWYEVEVPPDAGPAAALWRPGLQVKAAVRTGTGEPQAAAAVPADAVLYHEGRALVYVRVAAAEFQRREVPLLGREAGDWIVARRADDSPAGLSPGEEVVTRHAQVLLSEEFRGEGGDDD